MNTLLLTPAAPDRYVSDAGIELRRDACGMWRLYDDDGTEVDAGADRFDVAARSNVVLGKDFELTPPDVWDILAAADVIGHHVKNLAIDFQAKGGPEMPRADAEKNMQTRAFMLATIKTLTEHAQAMVNA